MLVSHTSSTVQAGQALAENTPLQGCSHDVVGLCAHKGTMCNTDDRVPRKLIKSQYEGGVLNPPPPPVLPEGTLRRCFQKLLPCPLMRPSWFHGR